MPGVPSGRGCTECRRVKKKCDQLQPSCSRCRRLNVQCVGGGLRRFKFVEASVLQRTDSFSTSDSSEPSRTGTPVVGISRKTLDVSLSPSNSNSQLASALAVTLSRSDDQRFSLVSAFGQFLQYVPGRLGTNAALDASVEALIAAHGNMCRRGGDAMHVLTKYTNAIGQLRTALDDSDVATSTETLCATMILSMTQSFSGDWTTSTGVGHITGMAKIMKYRGNLRRDDRDDFERELLATLRGPVVFEAMWNENIDFTDGEWENIAVNYQKPDGGPEQSIMLCASRLPVFQRRGRQMLWAGIEDSTLVSDTMATYHLLQVSTYKFSIILATVQQQFTDGVIDYATFVRIHFAYIRLHALGLSVIGLYGCLISAIHPSYISLEQDMYRCGTEILILAEKLQALRPLGASIVPIALYTSWMATSDLELRKRIEVCMEDFMTDYPAVSNVKEWISGPEGFEKIEARLKLWK